MNKLRRKPVHFPSHLHFMKTSTKSFFALFASVSLLYVPFAGAQDAQIQEIQETLQSEGYYFGPIDGNLGDQTTEALRRYQIRNGLSVTGQVDAETRSKILGASTPNAGSDDYLINPPGTPTPSRASTFQQDQDFLQNNPAQGSTTTTNPVITVPPPPAPGLTQAPTQNSPVTRSSQPTTTARTAPAAPRGNNSVREAQRVLRQLGYYQGSVDGLAGPQTQSAIYQFQRDSNLATTGRLDNSTLASLGLVGGGNVAFTDSGQGPALRAIPVQMGALAPVQVAYSYPVVATPVIVQPYIAPVPFFRPSVNVGVSFGNYGGFGCGPGIGFGGSRSFYRGRRGGVVVW